METLPADAAAWAESGLVTVGRAELVPLLEVIAMMFS
jgi:hypothetical protein